MDSDRELTDVVEALDDPALLRKIIERAGADSVRSSEGRQAPVAADIYVGRVLHTSVTELTESLRQSATAARKHTLLLGLATGGLFLATLALVAATLLR